MPGARILWMVTMKLSPVRMDENPLMKIPTTTSATFEFENALLYGV